MSFSEESFALQSSYAWLILRSTPFLLDVRFHFVSKFSPVPTPQPLLFKDIPPNRSLTVLIPLDMCFLDDLNWESWYQEEFQKACWKEGFWDYFNHIRVKNKPSLNGALVTDSTMYTVTKPKSWRCHGSYPSENSPLRRVYFLGHTFEGYNTKGCIQKVRLTNSY